MLDAAVPGPADTTVRAKLPHLHRRTAERIARRTRAVRSHLRLGCRYHQYETGPLQGRVRVHPAEVEEPVREPAP